MKKRIRSELENMEGEFRGLVKEGFTLDDELMVDLLHRIEKKRVQRKMEREAEKKANEAPAPPYLKDIVWSCDPKQETPRIGGRGYTKREFAMFAGPQGEAAYRSIMADIKWRKSPVEPWRVVAIHIMAWELAQSRQTFPTPSWLDLQAYGPRRHRTTDEAMSDYIEGVDDGLAVEPEEKPKSRKKKPTKKDILDAKYAELLKLL